MPACGRLRNVVLFCFLCWSRGRKDGGHVHENKVALLAVDAANESHEVALVFLALALHVADDHVARDVDHCHVVVEGVSGLVARNEYVALKVHLFLDK